MPKKKGANSIQPEQRLKWLKRFEDGESVFKIATDANVDHRTVNKHIKLARSEKELIDERGRVMRNALTQHFSDMLSIIDIILALLDTGEPVELSGDDEFIQDALRQHIPRSTIWPLLGNWNSYVNDFTSLKAEIREKLEKTVSSEVTLAALNENKSGELFRRMMSALKADEKNHGRPEQDIKFTAKAEIANLLHVLSTVFTVFAILDERELAVAQTALSKIQGEMEAWDEFTTLENQYHKLADVRTKLKEALRILKWKRVVPGRCRICPM
ncbi:MAG TPA: hypothetical protein VIH69_02815 [Dehalococcoidia bacterium]